MKRLLLVLPAIIAATLAWMLLAPAREPVWQGRPVSYWLVQLFPPGTNSALAMRAFVEMGSNALPCIRENLHARDSILRRKAFTLTRRYSLNWINYTPPQIRTVCALQALTHIGPSSADLLPDVEEFIDTYHGAFACDALSRMGSAGIWPLVCALDSTNQNTRVHARSRLESLPLDDDLKLAVLAAKLRSPVPETRRLAAQAFGVMRGLRTNAVIVLAPHLNDPDPSTRHFVVTSIYRVGTRPVVVPLMRRALTNSDDVVRRDATNILHILTGNPYPSVEEPP